MLKKIPSVGKEVNADWKKDRITSESQKVKSPRKIEHPNLGDCFWEKNPQPKPSEFRSQMGK